MHRHEPHHRDLARSGAAFQRLSDVAGDEMAWLSWCGGWRQSLLPAFNLGRGRECVGYRDDGAWELVSK